MDNETREIMCARCSWRAKDEKSRGGWGKNGCGRGVRYLQPGKSALNNVASVERHSSGEYGSFINVAGPVSLEIFQGLGITTKMLAESHFPGLWT